jgi:hypothetical protein
MNYKLAKQLDGSQANFVFSDIGCIPFDSANTDYQAYLKWLDGYEVIDGELVKTSEGNTPEPADE